MLLAVITAYDSGTDTTSNEKDYADKCSNTKDYENLAYGIKRCFKDKRNKFVICRIHDSST